jgi:hypothetical protein
MNRHARARRARPPKPWRKAGKTSWPLLSRQGQSPRRAGQASCWPSLSVVGCFDGQQRPHRLGRRRIELVRDAPWNRQASVVGRGCAGSSSFDDRRFQPVEVAAGQVDTLLWLTFEMGGRARFGEGRSAVAREERPPLHRGGTESQQAPQHLHGRQGIQKGQSGNLGRLQDRSGRAAKPPAPAARKPRPTAFSGLRSPSAKESQRRTRGKSVGFTNYFRPAFRSFRLALAPARPCGFLRRWRESLVNGLDNALAAFTP